MLSIGTDRLPQYALFFKSKKSLGDGSERSFHDEAKRYYLFSRYFRPYAKPNMVHRWETGIDRIKVKKTMKESRANK